MYNKINITIAGICVSFRIEGLEIAGKARMWYRDFVLPLSAKPDAVVDVQVSVFKRPSSKDFIYKEGVCGVGKKGDRIFFFFPELDAIVWAGSDHTFFEAYVTDPLNAIGLINYLLGVTVFSELLLRNEKPGALFHACSIADGKRGYLFPGPSESGKSTIARLRGKRYLLHDENVIVRRGNDGDFIMYRTPWFGDGDGKRANSAILTKVFFHRKAKRNYIVPINKKQAFMELIPNCFVFHWDSKKKEQFFSFCNDLIQGTPCYYLNFIKNDSFWKVIEK